MAGYIYITSTGTDPGLGHNLNDPIFLDPPTLGACMPNIRRGISPGDFLFTVSGRVPGVSQYVIGGFRVEEKIHMLEAFARFPEYRLREDDDAQVVGNIICNEEGHQDMLDHHDNFERRLDNYIIGRDPTVLSQPDEIQRGRDQTLAKISETMGKQGNRVIDIIGRMSKLDDLQAEDLMQWLNRLKDN